MIALDIETTGLPTTKGYDGYYPPSDFSKYDNSRVVSIGLYSDDFQKHAIIKPTDFTICNSEFHGVTQETATATGISLQDFFDEETRKRISESDCLVAHNLLFDINILKSEMLRQGLPCDFFPSNTVCTMKLGKEKLNLFKYPKLVELYYRLNNVMVKQTHNALDDAKMCYECAVSLTTEGGNW